MKKNNFRQILGKIALLLLFLVGSLCGIGRITMFAFSNVVTLDRTTNSTSNVNERFYAF